MTIYPSIQKKSTASVNVNVAPHYKQKYPKQLSYKRLLREEIEPGTGSAAPSTASTASGVPTTQFKLLYVINIRAIDVELRKPAHHTIQ